MTLEEDEQRAFERLLEAARNESPARDLGDRVLDHIAYRSRLEGTSKRPRRSNRRIWLGATVALAAGGALLFAMRTPNREPNIVPEEAGRASLAAPASSPSGSASPVAPLDPCLAAARAAGQDPLIDNFEDGDDAISPLEGRSGFWRWAREIDAPGTAPALMPVPRPDASHGNRLAQHVKGGRLSDWGATVEFNFRPGCYDASKYVGVSFQARGPGRIYVAPREVSVIPSAEGGTCDHDCYNPHVTKVDLEGTWRAYRVPWSELRQRGIGKPMLDPKRLHSIAFMIRAEDTPYDVWIDDLRFIDH